MTFEKPDWDHKRSTSPWASRRRCSLFPRVRFMPSTFVDAVAPAAHAEPVTWLGAEHCFDFGEAAALRSGEIYDVVLD